MRGYKVLIGEIGVNIKFPNSGNPLKLETFALYLGDCSVSEFFSFHINLNFQSILFSRILRNIFLVLARNTGADRGTLLLDMPTQQ